MYGSSSSLAPVPSSNVNAAPEISGMSPSHMLQQSLQHQTGAGLACSSTDSQVLA